MQTAFKVAYSLAVALLFVLFVILGIRTFYDEPEGPTFPSTPPPVEKPPEPPGQGVPVEPLYCDIDGRCFEGNVELTPEEEEKLTEEEREYVQEQREFNRRQREYEDDRVDYRRNVFVLASVLGVAAVAAGLALFRRVEAMPLGLLLGGIGVVIFGWVQAAGDFDEIGMGPLFAVVAIGLALVLAAGYWFLGMRGASDGGGG